MKRIFIILLLSSSLLGCATRYHSGEYFVTGYSETEAPGKLRKIMFLGNEFTDQAKVERYTLFRCAQLGKKLDKPYFAIYHTLTAAAENKKSSHAAFRTIFDQYEGYAYVLYKTKKAPGDLSVADIYARDEAAVLGNEQEGTPK